MPTIFPPKKNTGFTVYVEVRAQADPTGFKSGPTIAAGDFKASLDGGAYANLGTLPTASGAIITCVFANAEVNGYQATLKAEDAAGAEWVGRVWKFAIADHQLDEMALGVDYTTARAAKLDNLDTLLSGVAAAVWAVATRSITGTAVGALDTGSFTSAAEKAFADALLARNAKGGSDGPAAQAVAAAIAGGFMNMDITAGVLTVKYADGTTAFTTALTRTAGLDAITHSA